MKAIAVVLLFIGMFLVTQGYYTTVQVCPPPKVEIKYVPRSLYEEQLSPDNQNIISKQFQSMFESIQPWPGIQKPLSVGQNSR